jgi:hypothetical protein
MSQRVVTSFVNSNIPDAYPNVTVISQPVGLGSSGIVAIIGEADGGPGYQSVSLANNSFTPDQMSKVASTYLSGQIVDAMSALSAPSNDADITGTANLVYIIKTNNSTKASALLQTSAASPATYGTLQDQNWGVAGNNYKYQVTELASEVAPTVTGNSIPSFGALNPGMSPAFKIRSNGGVVANVILPPATYTTGTQVAAALTGLPGNITASGDATTITLTMTADPYANANGWGKSFEIIEGAAPGDAAALGLTLGLTVSSQEPEVEVDVTNSANGTNETLDVEPIIALMVGYAGTTATLTIASGMLTTTVTGGSGANLSINMSQYKTVNDLASFISSQTGYTAVCASGATQLAPSTLDSVAAIGICSTGASLTPGRIKNSASAFQTVLATSPAVQFVATATAGLPAVASAAFLSGGARGSTAPTDIVNALAQLAGIQCNIVVPLFSQDATEDIALGLTNSASTYTIAAINAAVKNHCIEYSTPKLKRNRICILSFWDNTENTYNNAKAMAQGLANYRCSLTCQQATQVNSLGSITNFMPWYNAVVAAGMQTGGFYKSITNKLANVISFTDPDGFDSGSPGDVEDALNAGLLVMMQTTAGNSWISDQTTYGFDTNFVYNSIQAVYASDLIALDLAASFKAAFVGKSLADVSAATGLSYLSQKMAGYMRIKLIAPSDDAPAGYKNAKVSILAPEMDVAVEIKLATAIYFIPISINISQVQQQAG